MILSSITSCFVTEETTMGRTFVNDLTGRRFDKWTVLEFVPTDDVANWWKCKCRCGVIRLVRAKNLTLGINILSSVFPH